VSGLLNALSGSRCSLNYYCSSGSLIREIHALARHRRLAVEIRMGVFVSHSVTVDGITHVAHDMSFASMGVL
jgi:hypothetical protein